MSDKSVGIYFIVFGILYAIYTIFLIDHKIHFLNSAITIGSIAYGIFKFQKSKQ